MRPGPHQFARRTLQIANNLLRPVDSLAASGDRGSDSPVMVVGLPRSGTTLTYEILVQAFETSFMTPIYDYFYGAPNTLTRIVARRTRNPVARYASNYGRIEGRYSPAENSVFWNHWFAEHGVLGHYTPIGNISKHDSQKAVKTLTSMSAISDRPYVFKNVYLTLSLPALIRLLPNANVVIVKRDIRATIASVYKKRQAQSAWWSLRPPFAGDMWERSTFEQTVFQCIRSQQILDDALSRLPRNQVLIMDYESICAEPHAFVRRVADWTGPEFCLRDSPEIPASFPTSPGPGLRDDESEQLKKMIDELDASAPEYLSRVDAFVREGD